MADKAIDELTAASALALADSFHILQSGNSREATFEQIRTLMRGEIAWAPAGSGQTATGVYDQAVDGTKATVDFTGLAGATDIMIVVRNVTQSASGVVALRVSVDNGSSYYAASGDYVDIAATGVETNGTGIALAFTTNATAARSGVMAIYGANVTNGTPRAGDSINAAGGNLRYFVASNSAINAVRCYPSGGGNITGGKIYCLARY